MLHAKKLLSTITLLGITNWALANTEVHGEIHVKLEVPNACQIINGEGGSAGVVNFGDLNFGQATALNTPLTAVLGADTGSGIQMFCTPGLTYTVALDQGANAFTGEGVRRLISEHLTTIEYNLYRDSSHTEVWGEGAQAVTQDATGEMEALNIYGKIPASTTAYPAGQYTDTVRATISW